jgi:hypothetical protein
MLTLAIVCSCPRTLDSLIRAPCLQHLQVLLRSPQFHLLLPLAHRLCLLRPGLQPEPVRAQRSFRWILQLEVD